MNRTKITPEQVEISLRALRSGKTPDVDLLNDVVNGQESKENIVFAYSLLLNELAWQSYCSARQVEGLPVVQPADRQEAIRMVTADFRTKNSELTAWSALYFRYLSNIDFAINDLSRAANVVPQQFRRRLKQGLSLLTQKLVIKALESEKSQNRPGIHLPLPEFTSLVGAGQQIQRLVDLFRSPDGARLVSLEGMGGIGKTALARALIAQPEIINNWERIIWVSARQNFLADDGNLSSILDPITTLEDITTRLCEAFDLSVEPLQQRLAGLKTIFDQGKHLIVVDNLETVEEYRQLVPALKDLSGSSRFLVTTRQSLREFAYVHSIGLNELTHIQAYELVSAEISRRGRGLDISTAQFEELYKVVGGLPLALKLVAAQLFLRPLADILNSFEQTKPGVENLYRYLYWQTWQALDDSARRLLLSFLPSDPEGEDVDFLQLMSGQSRDDFFGALKQLDDFSLLEILGDAGRPIYRLHRLTVTFLQSDVLNNWSDGGHE